MAPVETKLRRKNVGLSGNGGQFAAKCHPEDVHVGIPVPPQLHSIHDPQFRNLQGGVPHLDGATIRLSDGRQGRLEVRPAYQKMPEEVVVYTEDGVIPKRYMSMLRYRIESFEGDPQRLQDELEYKARANEVADRTTEYMDMRDRMSRDLLPSRDYGNGSRIEVGVITPPGRVQPVTAATVNYSNADGSRKGVAYYSGRAGVGLTEGSYESQAAKRIQKRMSAPDFQGSAARLATSWKRMLDAEDRLNQQRALISLQRQAKPKIPCTQ